MSQQALRVLVVEASGRGFLNHYSHALALGLHQQGVEVELLTGERDELVGWNVPFPKQSCIQSGRKGWRCVREKISRSKPDVVHFQWVDNPLAVYRLLQWMKRRGIKVVYTPHNVLPHEKRWILMPFYRLLYQAMDKVVARDMHIAWALEELLDVHKETIEHIPGSTNLLATRFTECDDSLFPDKTTGEKRILFFGHGCSRKGLDMLLKLFSENDWPEQYHLLLAGEGVLSKVPESLLMSARKKIKITAVHQYIAPNQVANLFSSANLLVMPYIKQCKSPLLDLAAALNLPVLKSNRVEGADFREHIHGLTFSHDDPDALLTHLRNFEWVSKVKINLHSLGTAEASIQRLAFGHKNLYQSLMNMRGVDIHDALLTHNKATV